MENHKKNSVQDKRRLHLIDEYRGFWIANMILYHAIWDLVYIFGYKWKWFQSDLVFVWQQWGCWSFIFISGFCWQMSKHHIKRGLQVFLAGLVITVVTLVFTPKVRVVFGVLTLLGSSILLMIPCDKLLKICMRRVPYFSLIGAIACFVLFLFFYPVNDGYLGFAGMEIIKLPRELYSNLLRSYLGFTETRFWSTDYFSILPWFFMYLVGYFTYSICLRPRGQRDAMDTAKMRILSKSICPPLGWIGRNSLIIYMLHQPVIYGILTLWN
ncbi:MAG: DUF1624 domain-containing protein [Agathobacter sp.]|nr:DUF1624 domain-containing protein [Agathobacter sp.]